MEISRGESAELAVRLTLPTSGFGSGLAVLVGANSAATAQDSSTVTLLVVVQVLPVEATAAFASGVTAEKVSVALPSFSMTWFCGELTWFCQSSGVKNNVAEFAATSRTMWSKYSAITRFPA